MEWFEIVEKIEKKKTDFIHLVNRQSIIKKPEMTAFLN